MDNNKSFFSSVLRDSVIVLLICILMLEGAFLIVTKAYIENQAIKNSHIMSLNYANYLDKILGEPVSALQAIKLNINYLNIKENRVKTELYSIITSMCSKNGYFYSIELLDVDGKVVLASGRSLSLKSDRSSTSAFLNRKKGNPIFWSSTFSSEHTGKTTLTLSYEFKNFTVVGYLNFDKISILTGDFQASNTADYKYYVTDEKGIYIYYEDKDLVAQRRVDPNFQTIRDIYNSEKTRLEEIINGKKAIVSVNKTKTANWYIVNYSDSKIISDSLAVVIAFFTISMLMLILTILFLFIKKSRNLTRLITQINLSSVEIAKGNYSEKMEAQKYSELNKTVEQFNLMVEDIQARDEKLLEIAYTDYLTKVANRAGLVKYLDEAIQNNPTNSFSIIYMDIDNFKRINDTYGHSIGDQLLVNLFKVLKKLSPVNSKLARIGGDEILIVYQCDGEKKNTKEFIEKLLKATKTPIAFDGKVFSITLSGGISLYPDDGNNFEELLRASDIALYYSKSNGKNIFTFFDEKMSKKLKRDFQIENNLKAAIERGEFYLVYQPVLGADEQIRGFEALIRWNNHEMGEVKPD